MLMLWKRQQEREWQNEGRKGRFTRERKQSRINTASHLCSPFLVIVCVFAKRRVKKKREKVCSVADLFTKIANASLKTFIESRICGDDIGHTALQDSPWREETRHENGEDKRYRLGRNGNVTDEAKHNRRMGKYITKKMNIHQGAN